MDIKKVRIDCLVGFETAVCGSDIILAEFPEIATTGVQVRLFEGGCWHIIDEITGEQLLPFFTELEMQYLAEI